MGKPSKDQGGGAQALLREGGVVMQLQVEDGNTRGPVCRDPGAASTQGGGACPFPFHVFPGGQVCQPRTAGADALPGPTVPGSWVAPAG